MQTSNKKSLLKNKTLEYSIKLTKLGDLMGIRFDQKWVNTYRVEKKEIALTLQAYGLEENPGNNMEAEKLLQTIAFTTEMQRKYSFFTQRLQKDNQGAGYLFVEQDYADLLKTNVRKKSERKEKLRGLGSMVSEYRKGAAFYGVMAAIFAGSIFPIGIEKAREFKQEASVDFQLKEQYLQSLEEKIKEQKNQEEAEEEKLSQPLIGIRRGHLILLGYPTVFYEKVNQESEAKYHRPIPKTFDEARFITNFMLFNPQEHQLPEVDKDITWEEFQGYLGFPINDGDSKKEIYQVLSSTVSIIE